MTLAEFYTSQFYAWEFRGRGWFVADAPVHLEPPFIPYYRHGYPKDDVDDGKRHTFLSKTVAMLKGTTSVAKVNTDTLDYATIEPYMYTEDIDLQCLKINLPKNRKGSAESMKALLVLLSYITTPLSFEIIGTATEIRLQFVGNGYAIDALETYLIAFFPQYRMQRSDIGIDIIKEDCGLYVVDFGLKHEFIRPLQTIKGAGLDPLLGVYAVLERLKGEESIVLQMLFQPTVNQWSDSIRRSVTMHDGTSFFIDAPDFPVLATQKVQSPLYGVTIRALAQANTEDEAAILLQNVGHALIHASKGTANELIALSNPDYTSQERIDDMFFRESHRLGMLLNVDELITFVHFPGEHIVSKKLYTETRTTKAVPAIAQDKRFILGNNTHEEKTTFVSVDIEDRLKHTHIIGATGTGKSTLILNLICQDIERGVGVVVFDPHGDLIDDILASMNSKHIVDTVLIDPADIEYPIGLNVLEAYTDVEKEVLSSDIVATFRKYATSWGDQMNSVLGNAVLAILESTQGGSLHDLRRFLLEKEFRQTILQTVTDVSVLYYWQHEFPLLKTTSIGPILTRLDTFLRPKSIRNMVVQKKGLDFEALCNDNKIILCKLSQGLIGKENSYLLGSLILSKLHQAILRRQQQVTRNPFLMYLDEFQNFMTPSIKEMISGVRKYNVGLILSHQDLQQLQREDGELLNSVLGNCNIRIVFRVGEPDAKRLQDGFTGFNHNDLQNLGRGEAIVRIEQPQYDCSLDTLPPLIVSDEQRENNSVAATAHTRNRYATAKADVEAMLFESLQKQQPKEADPKKEAEAPPASKPNTEKEEIQPQPYPPRENKQPNRVFSKKKEPTLRPAADKEEEYTSPHRYLQAFVKKMAEDRGYVATIEAQLPDGTGKVDILLTKDTHTIAVEVCNTTDPEWEVHNIEKCLAAGYDTVVSLSGDPRQLEKIKQKCEVQITAFETKPIHFFTTDALFAFLDTVATQTLSEETIIKGYRVNVTYENISPEEMNRKQVLIAKTVTNALQRKKGKKS